MTEPKQKQVLFVAGTDTGIGKTAFSLQVLRSWLGDSSLNPNHIAYVKPFQTGTKPEDRDSEVVLRSGIGNNSVYVLEDFSLLASPHLAAKEEGKTINMHRALERTQALIQSHSHILVEGSGGLWVPIEPEKQIFLIDFVEQLARSVPETKIVLVARLGLGTINHTLLSAFALRERGVRLSKVALNNFFADEDDRINQDNKTLLETTLNCPVEVF